MSATPVGYLYTPQQLMGSVKYSSGILLGNWREDDALDEKRLMDHVEAKGTMSLTLLQQEAKIGPQLQPVPLSPAPAAGAVCHGDTVLLKSLLNGGTLAVSVGQKLASETLQHAMFCCPPGAAVARNAITISSFGGAAPMGGAICYGEKVLLTLSCGGLSGCLASARSGGMPFSTQLINKQEVYHQYVAEGDAPPYACAWCAAPLAASAPTLPSPVSRRARTPPGPCSPPHPVPSPRPAQGVPARQR